MTSILVAEDEDRLASLIVRALSRAGFLVERVATGTAALDAALSGRYQLVLLDIGLPELDGISVLERIRRLDGSLPILLVTADNAPQHIVRGLAAGADDYIPKPFRFDELVARVEANLRKARAVQTVLVVGDLTLDLMGRTASTPDVSETLPIRELELLEYLMRRPGATVTREQLLADIWGIETARSSNVIDVYVRHLRRRLGADVVETVRGEGYRIGA
ncbi:response regulator transcription factor [Schumannella luteola]|uniref:DNA-binding response OmpR family regulator n=1 Tax=Schumannella luteola TaxID=472059 RepID=A0A852YE74_9MICO|nr:response regulator transcription factor [Schumannella luteola]NYG97987.1 DNA-binding response OmpR family regulator [Schumannella luteola]TPX01722.1 response regulator transcription factor [Schumannella luteola]